jgi:hypothetical protein
VALADLAPLVPVLDLRSFDRVSRYEITRQGIGRGIRAGVGRDDISPALVHLTGRPVPQNVAFSLSEWTADYDAIGLLDCVMLTVSEERRHLVEHSAELAPFILKRPAEGVYALDREREAQWSSVLRRIGISVLPGIAGRTNAPAASGPGSRIGELLAGRSPGSVALFALTGDRSDSRSVARSRSENRERELIKQLEQAQLPDSGKEELALRIKRKLVVLPEQIRSGAVRPERREAKGLDYVGKVRIIEEAIQSVGIHLEVILRGKNGRPERLLMRPHNLDKRGTELVLVGTTMPDDTVVRIEVGKIGLVRKLRGSLFHGSTR